MRVTLNRVLILAIAGATLAACGEASEQAPSTDPEPAAGQVLAMSEDGTVTVFGQSDVDVTVKSIQPSEVFSDLSALGMTVLEYELGPSGTEFAEPMTVTFTVDAGALDVIPEQVASVVLGISDDGVEYQPMEDVGFSWEGSTLTVTGTTTHFSQAALIIEIWPRVFVEAEGWVGETVPIELDFTTILNVVQQQSLDYRITNIDTATVGAQPQGGGVGRDLPMADLAITCRQPRDRIALEIRTLRPGDVRQLGGLFHNGYLSTWVLLTCNPERGEAERALATVPVGADLSSKPDSGRKLVYVQCPTDDCKREATEYATIAAELKWTFTPIMDNGAGFCDWSTLLDKIADEEADVVVLRSYFWGVDSTHCPQESAPFEKMMANSGVVVGVNTADVYSNLIGYSRVPLVNEAGQVADAIIEGSGGAAQILAYGHDGVLATDVGNQIRERCPGCTIVTATDLEPDPSDLVANAIAALGANPGVTYVQSWADFINDEIQAWAASVGRQLTFFADREEDYDSADFTSSADTRPRESPEMRARLSIDAALRWFDGIDPADLTEIPRYSRTMLDELDPFPKGGVIGLPEDWRTDFTRAWKLSG